MTSDLRYHIASLSAVFLALGIGIIVGTAFVGAPVVERQNRLIQKMDASVDVLRRETQEMARNESVLLSLLPRLVAHRLEGRRVLVVQVGDYAEAAERSEEVLRLAGASVTRVTLPLDSWLDLQHNSGDVAAETERLARILVVGDEEGAVADYRRRKLLTGESLKGPVRLVVLVGGSEARGDTEGAALSPERDRLIHDRDTELLRSWTESGITVVGTEPMSAAISSMRLYQAQDIGTVDNIDRAAGRLALPYVLAGDRGAFGMKPTADRLLPPTAEQIRGEPAAS